MRFLSAEGTIELIVLDMSTTFELEQLEGAPGVRLLRYCVSLCTHILLECPLLG